MAESRAPYGGYSGAEEALFVPGVDYVSPWKEAHGVAEELNTAVAALGVDARLVRAVAHVGPRGEPVIQLRLEDARVLIRELRAGWQSG
ncbi:hypothetical protein SAMN04487981_10251 [Streptomyces sp. cf386]|uniref:hypothetical protein n=1 Tax=Streptomyces sp. cf386 TaxID=1761904 RepID=UPI000884B953|nr:hypothetical protein [Streptomyces sp. cf386]SDM63009.1 hypothetical protein SAMN04487981_10251 [Streptomyces sp. cf386]